MLFTACYIFFHSKFLENRKKKVSLSKCLFFQPVKEATWFHSFACFIWTSCSGTNVNVTQVWSKIPCQSYNPPIVIWSCHIPNSTFSNSIFQIGIGNGSVVHFSIHSVILTNIVSKTSLYLWYSPNMGLNWLCLLCVPGFDCLATGLIWLKKIDILANNKIKKYCHNEFKLGDRW